MRIFFTGGSGKAGRHVAPYLAEQGHHVTNADLVPLEHPAVADLRVDLTDAGETYSALAGLATFDELDLPEKPTYDAVVHFAAVPAILLTSDAATYATNVLSTYNVLEAATRLGVRKIVFASSETTYGICFAQGERRPLYVPVDEEHPTVPEDAYAMSKVAGEVTARSFHVRTGADVYGLRINNVIEPHEYAEMFPPFLTDPSLRRRNLFAYIDVRDLGQMVQRCLKIDGLGYEVFNVANADMSVAATTQELQDRFYDGVEVWPGGGCPSDRRGSRRPVSQTSVSRLLHGLGRFSQSPVASASVLVVTMGFFIGALLAPETMPVLGAFEAMAAAVTLVMVFTLQHTQARQQVAVQSKLDEILQSLPDADKRLVQVENASGNELADHTDRHTRVRDDAVRDPR